MLLLIWIQEPNPITWTVNMNRNSLQKVTRLIPKRVMVCKVEPACPRRPCVKMLSLTPDFKERVKTSINKTNFPTLNLHKVSVNWFHYSETKKPLCGNRVALFLHTLTFMQIMALLLNSVALLWLLSNFKTLSFFFFLGWAI